MKKQIDESKKKILYITRKYPPQVGGMENFSYNLYNGLNKQDDIDLKLIALRKKQWNLIWFFPYVCAYVLLFSRQFDFIFIGDGVLCFLGVLSKFSNPRIKRVINVFGLDITYPSPIYQAYLKSVYTSASDLYICISAETEKTLLKKLGEVRTLVITPGINIPKPQSLESEITSFKEKYGIESDSLIAITVGRLVKRKGVQWFIDSVLPKLKDINIKYFVIGEGEDYTKIEKSISNYNLEKNAMMLGKIEQAELDLFYKYADLFIMPNIKVAGDMEGFGLVAAEASAAGALVIAADLEGIKDAIKSGKNGILLPSRNDNAFENAIRKVYTEKSHYSKMAQQFSMYTQTMYGWNKICDEYSKAFDMLADK